VGLVFLLLLAVQIVSSQLALSRGSGRLRVAVYLAGILLALRLARLAYSRGIWRLRNRLLAAYLFMAVVPILLIATLAIVGIRAAASQLAVYLVTSELDRRIEGLQLLGESLALEPPATRKIDSVNRKLYPGIAVLLRDEYQWSGSAARSILFMEPPQDPFRRRHRNYSVDARVFEPVSSQHRTDRFRDANRGPVSFTGASRNSAREPRSGATRYSRPGGPLVRSHTGLGLGTSGRTLHASHRGGAYASNGASRGDVRS
jgi:hypothetical protein